MCLRTLTKQLSSQTRYCKYHCHDVIHSHTCPRQITHLVTKDLHCSADRLRIWLATSSSVSVMNWGITAAYAKGGVARSEYIKIAQRDSGQAVDLVEHRAVGFASHLRHCVRRCVRRGGLKAHPFFWAVRQCRRTPTTRKRTPPCTAAFLAAIRARSVPGCWPHRRPEGR